MNLITAKEAAEEWGVTPRRVQGLCNEGRIKGATRWGRTWMIPAHAVLPKGKKEEDPHLPMPRKSPFLDMTNIYSEPGTAEESIKFLENNPEAHALLRAQIAYRRGEIDKVYEHARYFLSAHSGFYAILGGGMLLALCAIWRGDINLWYEAKKHIFEAPHKSAEERDMISLALAVIDSSVYDNRDYPEWFTRGSFAPLHADSHPTAKVFYAKYLYMTAFAIASKQMDVEGVQGLALMRMLPFMVEPMISQAVVDKTVIPEIYLRLSCAVSYHNSGDRAHAIEHIDKAVALALPDRLYGILTEYVRHFDHLLEERIELVDPEALIMVKNLYKIYSIGWSKLSGAVRGRLVASNLYTREREVAKLVAFGFTNKDIARMLFISESTVKQTILRVVQKTGVKDKSEFSNIL
jgi:DNA-binding CsgD family transcriptional regulator